MEKQKGFSSAIRQIGSDRAILTLVTGLVLISFVLGNVVQPYFKITLRNSSKATVAKEQKPDLASIQEKVLPQNGYKLNFKWGDLGKKLVDDGVVDESKLANALTGKDGPLPDQYKKYLDGSSQQVILNSDNAQFWVDVLWGLGLANKNPILDEGPMVENGETASFASTGGYTIGGKDPMRLYSKSSYIALTPEQQKMVQEMAEGIYRPCCGNSTAFPDCNHGMAALALVELMVSQNFSKEEIYKTVLDFNSYWFPQTYLDIAYHFEKNGKDYNKVSPAEILSKTFSSSQGYQVLKQQIGPVDWPSQKRSGCGA